MTPPLHIVLFQPEIPPNTGNIARLCACTACRLHLVHPLGFSTSNRHLKRAGLDYWAHLDVREHANWAALKQALANHPATWHGLTTQGGDSLWETRFQAGDVLVFGPETRGLPAEVLAELHPVRIPMRQDAPVRSLNLSSAAAIAVYEVLRQIDVQPGLC